MKLGRKALAAVQFDRIIEELDAGFCRDRTGPRRFYSADPRSDSRAAARIVKRHAPHLTDTRAQQLITKWLQIGVLVPVDYPYRSRLERGVRTNAAGRRWSAPKTQPPGDLTMTAEHKITGVYLTTIFSNGSATMMPLAGPDIETMKLRGRSYYLIPVEQHQRPVPPAVPRVTTPIVHSETQNTVADMYRRGFKVTEIARRLGRSVPWVYGQMKLAGVRTHDAQLEETITEIVLEASDGVGGADFRDHPKVTALYPQGRAPIGPTLAKMVKAGTIKRLEDGRWTVA